MSHLNGLYFKEMVGKVKTVENEMVLKFGEFTLPLFVTVKPQKVISCLKSRNWRISSDSN